MPFIRRDHFPHEPDILNDYVPSRPRNIHDAPLSAMPGEIAEESLKRCMHFCSDPQDHRRNLPPPRTKATPENLRLVKAMIADGRSISVVAAQLGVQKRTVENWIAKGILNL